MVNVDYIERWECVGGHRPYVSPSDANKKESRNLVKEGTSASRVGFLIGTFEPSHAGLFSDKYRILFRCSVFCCYKVMMDVWGW